MSSDRDITQRKENGQLSWARDLNSMIPTENIPSSASCSGVTTTTTESNETMSSQKKSFFSSMTPYTTSPHTTTAVPTVGSNPVLENVYPPNNPVTVQTSQTGQSGYRVDPFSEESRGVQGSIPGVSDFNRSQPTTPYELNSVSDDAKLMVYMGVDCVLEIFSVQSSRTRDFCRLFVKIGLLRHISLAFDCIYMLLNRSTPCCSPGCWIDKTQKLKYGSVNTLSNSNLNLNSNTNCSLISRCPSKNGHERTPSNVSDYDLNSKPDDVHSIQECRYLNSIASIFLKFSRSDATVALHMAGDTAVIQCIMTVLKDPRLRTPTPTPMSSTAAAAAGAGAGATTATSFGTGTGTASASAMNYDSVTSAGSVDTKNSSLSATTNTNTNTINIEKKGFLGLSALGMSRCTLGIIETLLKCLKNLSMESSALADLEKAGTIPMLISLLGGPVSHRCKNHIVPCIFNLCRINKRRQEDAAMHGLIPHLQSLIANDSHLKQFALPILCSLAYTSAKTRLELVKHGGAAFYINLLKESYWQTFALNSLAVW